jgi:RNA polymerase sigma-70 factor (ECF subfamily)
LSIEPEFERFFVANFDDLVRSLTAITGDREQAADCVQEAFVKAYARWRRVCRMDSPVTWVRRVAINKSRDTHRSERRRRRREDRVHATPDGPDPGVVPDSADVVAGEMNTIAMLQQLPHRQRSVAALFYLEDAGINEIADSLGISPGAVKFHLNKARGNLRPLVEKSPEVSIEGGAASDV